MGIYEKKVECRIVKINFGDLFREKDGSIVYRLDHGYKVGSKFCMTPLGEDPDYVDDEYAWWIIDAPYPVTKRQIESDFIKLRYDKAAKFLLEREL